MASQEIKEALRAAGKAVQFEQEYSSFRNHCDDPTLTNYRLKMQTHEIRCLEIRHLESDRAMLFYL